MFRQLLDEAFEEFKQTVAPTRPEISTPRPPGVYPPPPTPRQAEPMVPRTRQPVTRAAPAPARPASSPQRPASSPQRPTSTPQRPAQRLRPSGLRAQLGSRESIRSAFIMMEVLRPPVSLRGSIDPLDDR